MKHLILIIAFVSVYDMQAQKNSYVDEVIGWKTVYNFTSATKSQQVGDKTYSASQITLAGEIANWMQMSYMPKGTLGDVKKTVLPKAGLYNAYVKALPHAYGAVVYSYVFLKKDAQNKWINETSHAYVWRIMANEVPNADYYGIPFLSSDATFYFTIPQSEETRWDHLQENTNQHPVIKKYYHKTLPDFGGASHAKLIIISKNNVFPFHHLTIGEVLNLIETSINNWFEVEQKRIAERRQYPAVKDSYKDYEYDLKIAKEKVTSAKMFLIELKTKYKNKSSEPAYLSNGKFDVFDLINRYDIFSGNESTNLNKNFPVYTIKPEIQSQCKTNQPQWFSIMWSGGTLDEPAYKHLTESILNNFNFDYLYQYFFDSTKIGTQKYQPLKTL